MVNKNIFDPIAWAKKNRERRNENQHMAAPSPVNNPQTAPSEDEIRDLVSAITAHGAGFSDDYGDWLKIGFALAGELGERGRSYFHQLSQLSSKYDERECDKKYSNCLRTVHTDGHGVNISTLYWMAKNVGVNLSEFAKLHHSKEFCADCANAQPCAKGVEKCNSLIINNSNKNHYSAQGCANAQSAQNSDKEDEKEVPFHQTFSDKIPEEDWCGFLKPVLESMDEAQGKDKMILSTLVILSGMMPNYYGIYGRHTFYPPLYIILYGPSASRKGEISSCQYILNPLRDEIVGQWNKEKEEYTVKHQQWESMGTKAADRAMRGEEPQEPEYRSPIIPANSSASATYVALKANDGWGIMFETEACLLAQSLVSDYGDYSPGILMAFDHSPITMNRRKDNTHIDIQNPRLAICLTCTPGLLPKLFPSFENGLGSRFLFYGLDRKLEWISPFSQNDKPLDEIYGNIGKEALNLYHVMKGMGNRRIQFVLSTEQIAQFDTFFSDLLKEQFHMLGDGISSFIFRLGVSTFRIAMVLSLLRRYSDWDQTKPFFEEEEQAITCNDTDFKITMTIMNTLVNHTANVYDALAKDDEGPDNRSLQELSMPERSLFNALGNDFTTKDVTLDAVNLSINPETARRYLGHFCTKYHVAVRDKNGQYHKVKKAL